MSDDEGRAPRALGEAVRQLRLDAGVTQQELAARLNVPQSWVSNIEGARRRLGVLEALDIMAALGCRISDLIHEFEVRYNAGK